MAYDVLADFLQARQADFQSPNHALSDQRLGRLLVQQASQVRASLYAIAIH